MLKRGNTLLWPSSNLVNFVGVYLNSQTGAPLGSEKFRNEIEELLGVKKGYSKRGRPSNSS